MPATEQKRRRWLIPAAALVGIGLIVGVPYLHTQVAAADKLYSEAAAPARSVGIVFGAKAHPQRPSWFLAARLEVALRLYQDGKIKTILVSGDGSADSNNEPRIMRTYLEERGVPAAAIVEDPHGYDTYDTCVRAMRDYDVTSATLITQRYHLPRALTVCTSLGLDAIGVADTSAQERFPAIYGRNQARELLANLKMEWDLLSGREPKE
ncbi:MAG: hypothetical protein CSA63_01090 [Propionibacterium sp.]|nr:MAG: hypothetical protein CSA63_01090 [Propionibacterium sp.]